MDLRWFVSGRRQFYLIILLVAALSIALQVAVGHFGLFGPKSGQFFDPDSYTYLLRVQQFNETGSWFANDSPRSNAPFGASEHWTRPFDVLLLAGAKALEPILGFEKGLVWWGMFVSPALFVITTIVICWAGAPILSPGRRLLACALLPLQYFVLSYSVSGRADHHTFLMLIFVVSLGLTLRMVTRPLDARLAVSAGAVVGFGLWVSVEFLLVLASVLATLSVTWLRWGGDHSRKNLWFSAGLLMMATLALILERYRSGLLGAEYDKISIAHFTLLALVLGFWAAVDWVERRGQDSSTLAQRLRLAVFGGALVVGSMVLAYPKFFSGPMVDINPALKRFFWPHVSEVKPLLFWLSRSEPWRFIALGLVLICAPVAMYRVAVIRRDPTWGAWLLFLAGMAIFVPATLYMIRFAPFLEILNVFVLAEALGLLASQVKRHFKQRLLLPVGLAFCLTIPLGYAAMARLILETYDYSVQCDRSVIEMAHFLNELQESQGKPSTILAELRHGSELLYRTEHSVVGSMSHRNVAGIIDTMKIFYDFELDIAKRLIDRRGVDLILICRTLPIDNPEGLDVLYVKLREGRPPEWLHRVRLPLLLTSDFLLYEVGE